MGENIKKIYEKLHISITNIGNERHSYTQRQKIVHSTLEGKNIITLVPWTHLLFTNSAQIKNITDKYDPGHIYRFPI